MKVIKIVAIVLALAFFAYAFFYETYDIHSLSDDSKKEISGSDFLEQTTFDGLMLESKKLFDIYSLTPEMLQEKDCAT